MAFNAALLSRLPAEHRAKLISYLDGGAAIDWCSLCAGADVPILGVSCLKDALYASSGCVANMPELYTAEKRSRKRNFRMAAYRDMPEHMFGDLADLASGDYALDYISGGSARVRQTEGMIEGSPCQDVSRCNQASRSHTSTGAPSDNRATVLDGSMRTGLVFNFIAELMARWGSRPVSSDESDFK